MFIKRDKTMKVPKTKNMHCPKCNAHTEHKISIYKPGKARKMAEGARRYQRHKKGYSGQPKPIFRKNAKINKKTTPMYKCSKCGFTIRGQAHRVKKFEIYNK